jgi:2-oxoisovalerate dehydrogenase E2 component (dihydrolipoyl transacylase)
MSEPQRREFIFKMPDLGEGTVEAEIVRWHTKPGDAVSEDQPIVEVMTDKAAVEVPAPVSGVVLSITGAPGDKVAVGAPLIVFALDATDAPDGHATGSSAPDAQGVQADAAVSPRVPAGVGTSPRRVMASPANRRRAREAGIDLTNVAGTGPRGRILQHDIVSAAQPAALRAAIPAAASTAAAAASTLPATASTAARALSAETTEIKIIGVRRVIAERMSEAKRTIPHFTYVEEVDVTELEALRRHLNGALPADAPALTYLPLVVAALVRTLAAFPQCNVLHDAARGVLVRHAAAHVGIATQTGDGLKVPVVRHAESLSLWQLGAEIRRVTEAARSNRARREELMGSTITVTSLGKLGGVASTPVINAPEVAIVGINKAAERPVIRDGAVAVRRIMNISSSFDHRFVDGYDAAEMIQALKGFLENPATIFIPKVDS